MFIELGMPSNHLNLCQPLLILPSIFPSIRVFSNESAVIKASADDGIPAEVFQILKDDANKVLHSICQQIWKTREWPQDWKRSIFIPISKKGSVKECSNYWTIALISHASKAMLKTQQGRNPLIPDSQKLRMPYSPLITISQGIRKLIFRLTAIRLTAGSDQPPPSSILPGGLSAFQLRPDRGTEWVKRVRRQHEPLGCTESISWKPGRGDTAGLQARALGTWQTSDPSWMNFPGSAY